MPQRGDLNQGIWLDLEERTAEWADEFGAVWIMTGPIVFNDTPSQCLGQDDEVPVAIPDAFFKIVATDSDDGGVEDWRSSIRSTGCTTGCRAARSTTMCRI